jgi:hypothetical protein
MDSLGESASATGKPTAQASASPELRVEHTPGLCQPVTLYLGAADGSELVTLLRERLGRNLDARVDAAQVAIRLVPTMPGYEPWTADPLDPFAGDAHDEVTIGIPPERNEAVAAACEAPPGTYTWPWFPELKIVRF